MKMTHLTFGFPPGFTARSTRTLRHGRTLGTLCAIPTLALALAACNNQTPSTTQTTARPDAAATQTGTDNANAAHVANTGQTAPDGTTKKVDVPKPREIATFVRTSIDWLVEAQNPNGGWGAGSHSAQDVRDPHQVQTDPATTAFAATALLRSGHSLTSGDHQAAVRRATQHLIDVVDKAADEGPRITDLQNTQPQTKLGQLIDTAMTANYLARVATTLPATDPIKPGVDRALAKCIKKLQQGQQQDGSWGQGGGWAPVLQSSMATNSLELAQAAGFTVDQDKLDNAKKYQRDNFDADTGRAKGDAAAGVELYSFAGSQRANASEARAADELVKDAKASGKVAPTAPMTTETLVAAGARPEAARGMADAYKQNESQVNRVLGDEGLLTGFGNNGGEEYLSYMLTSESMVITGGERWTQWNDKIHERLAKIQNADGSYSGQHCITSPVFCTAAVVQCLTADRDAEILVNLAKMNAAK